MSSAKPLVAPKKEVKEEVKVETTKKEFACQFFNKELGGCGVKCPKNRNVCCFYCPMITRCMGVPEIEKEICKQVKECK